MPTYEYYCKACDHEWEREQRISDAPLKTCPSCKARKAKRMISQTSFVLKGSGWYSDLYSSSGDKKKKKKKADGDTTAAPSDGGSAKKDKSEKSSSGGDKKSGSGKKGSGSKGSGSKAAA